jgi:hypothetical protein
MSIPPFFRYLISVRSKYCLQQHVLKLLQYILLYLSSVQILSSAPRSQTSLTYVTLFLLRPNVLLGALFSKTCNQSTVQSLISIQIHLFATYNISGIKLKREREIDSETPSAILHN